MKAIFNQQKILTEVIKYKKMSGEQSSIEYHLKRFAKMNS